MTQAQLIDGENKSRVPYNRGSQLIAVPERGSSEALEMSIRLMLHTLARFMSSNGVGEHRFIMAF